MFGEPALCSRIGKGGSSAGGRFHSSGSIRGPLPGAALTPTIRPHCRGSPRSFQLEVPRESVCDPERIPLPCGPAARVLGAPQSGVERRGTHRVSVWWEGHWSQERDTAIAIRQDPEGRRGPRGDRGAAVCPPGMAMSPQGSVLAPRGAGLVIFLLRAGGVDHRGPCPTHHAQIAFHPSLGRGHHDCPSTPGCPGVSSCSWRCWWLADARARGFARRLAPRGFGEGMAIQPRKMYFPSRLSRVFPPPARCRWQRALRPVKHSVCRAGSRRSSDSLIS